MVRRLLAPALLLLAAAAGPAARAEGPAKPPAPPAPGPADGDLPPPSRVYIPFEDLKRVFEKEGQGVFVPYAEFQELWRRAMDRDGAAKPPSGVATALYEGRVEGDIALLEATLEVLCPSDAETAVPVGLAGAVLGDATLDGKPAVLLAEKGGHRVLVRGKGTHTLRATLVAAVRPKDGDRTVSFPSAGAPVSRLSFAVPGEGVKVVVEPNLATTRTDGGSGVTRVMAYVGAAPAVTLTWRPRPAERTGAEAVLQASSEVLHRVGEQTLETRAVARFSVLRGGLRTFRARFPAGERVLQVEGAGIRDWSEVEEGGVREVRVDLHNEVEGAFELRLLLERPRAEGEGAADLPVLLFPGASRDAGTVAVQVLPPVAVRPAAVEGLYRVPTDDLPEWMRTGHAPLAPGVTVLAWRHAGGPRRLSLALETVAPEVSVSERSVLDLSPGSAVLRAALDLAVERAGLFLAAVRVPEGWDLESATLSGQALDARIEGEGGARRLLLDLGTRRSGAVPILLALRRSLDAGPGEASLPLPVLEVEGAARARGLLAVAAEEALDVRSAELRGFLPAEPAILAAAGLPPDTAPPPRPRAVLFGFRHAGGPRSGSVLVLRRKPEVVAEAVTVVGVEEDRLHLRHALRFSVRYAGVDTFRFSLPAEVADRARVQGPGVKEQSRAADPAAAGRVVTTVVLQAPALGTVDLSVEYDLPGDPVAAGSSRRIPVPALLALGAEREQGWYAVTRDPALSVEGEETGLLYADPREVPDFAGAGEAFLAWRRLAPAHSLTLAVARHEPVRVLQAVVNALALDTLVGGGAAALTEARMDVQVNGLQYLRVELPPGAELESAEVDGRPVSPRTEGGALLLPCPAGRGRDDRFGVRVVYREDAAGAEGRWFSVALAAPRVPEAMVQATAWTAWVPPDAVLFSGGGNLRPAEDPSVLGAVLDALDEVFGARPRAGRPTAGGGALPPAVTLTVAGRAPFSFQRTGEAAVLEARFLPRSATGGLALLCGVVALAAGWWLARRGVPAAASALALAAAGLALFPVAAPGLRATLAALCGA
ncbi:MAG: hypothetical protein L6R43_15820, partial [Planctomycetes bacterium]|nr:hypothetical protein [Planctomycetota bacterium]